MSLYVIPGNHDGPAPWEGFPDLAARRPTEGLGYTADVGPLKLIMFDSTLRGKHHGAAGSERCDWLAGALGDGPSLMVLHHPPFVTGIWHMNAGLPHAVGGLKAAVRGAPGLLAIGCGHVHRMIVSSFVGVPAIVAPSVAHAVRFDLMDDAPAGFDLEPPGLLMHRIQKRDGAWSCATHTVLIGPHPGPFPFDDQLSEGTY